MDESSITLSVYTPFADLDLLYGEQEQGGEPAPAPATPAADALEPETVDAFNAQILAGLVSP
jgi:hypothetical protein